MEIELKKYTKEEIIVLLKEIGDKLKEEIAIYLIGGCNMSLKNIKAITRDIDLILLTKKEYENLKEALVKIGYECREETFCEEFYKTPIVVFLKEDKRIDVFIKNVSNQIELTREMQKRSKEYVKFNNLKVMLIPNEDIFLFKSITNREKDVDDCYSLIQTGLNWEIVKAELHQQETRALWRFWVYEQLARIKSKYKITTPIEDYIYSLVKEKYQSKPADFMNGIEDEQLKSLAKKLNKSP